MTTTNDGITVPEYLNAELFKSIVHEALDNDVEYKEHQIQKLVANGSYCSNIYKVQLAYQRKGENQPERLDLFVKELFENLTTASKEYFMYKEVLPAFNAFVSTRLSPRVYLAQKAKTELHVFEDLSEQGYKLLDRLVGYDAAQTEAVLKKLAKFHAASFKYTEGHRQIVESLTGHFYQGDTALQDFSDGVVLANTNHVAPIVAQWPGYASIAAKMRLNTGATYRRKMLQALDKKRCQLRIVLHGDVWIRNIMMRHAEGSDDNDWDAVFLDYQNSFEGSPVLDIINLLLTSVQLEVLQIPHEQLLAGYQRTLADQLRSLGFAEERVPTMQMLLEELRLVEYYNYYLLIFPFAQTNLSDKLADGASFNDFFDTAKQQRNRVDIFSNPRVLETYKFMLKRLDGLGVLD